MIKYLILALSLFVGSVNAVEQCNAPRQVSLSFDDDLAIDSFYDNLYLFSQYNAKVTLYVAKWPNLTQERKQKLLAIQAAGQEIGNHSLWHHGATDYTPTDYRATEVDPAIPYARGIGLGIFTFAYPFGSRTPLHDVEILKSGYTSVRGFTSQYTELHPSSKPSITAYSIDAHNINLNQIYQAMDMLNAGETLYLATHVIGPWVNEWHISVEDLEAILSYGASNNIKFCSIKDC